MKSLTFIFAFLIIHSFSVNAQRNQDTIVANQHTSKIELVFCLDATGSMSGLIATAKTKIWEIVTSLAQSTPSPEIKLGFVFYRDRGDAYVTKVVQMTTDIDSVYSELLLVSADGGGDTPESLNAALHDAVTKMQWSEDGVVYRTIFVVGDCPPHMDYEDDVKYDVSCKLAKQKGIIINSIKLGTSCMEAIPHFKALSECTNGNYQQLGQNADDFVIQTPYDDSIYKYSYDIDNSKLYYGSIEEQQEMNERNAKSLSFYSSASVSVNGDRAMYNSTESGKSNWFGKKEITQELIDGKVVLDSIAVEELPEVMQKMSKEEREAFIEKKKEERVQQYNRLMEFTTLKAEFIRKEMENSTQTSFSKEIYKVMQEQAKRFGVILMKI